MTAATGHLLEIFADYVDGLTARVQRVAVTVQSDRLRFAPAEGREIIWPADDLRELPDQADRVSLVLSHAGDPLARLRIDDPKLAAQLRANAPGLARRPPPENRGKVLGWGLAAAASVALIIFALVPLLANQLAALLPPAGEQALGDATYAQIRTALSDIPGEPIEICDGSEGLAALDSMLARLDATEDLPYPLNVTVFDNDLVNAFALPGGRVVLFRGLIEAAGDPDEVAAVLAHEIGHVVHRDPTRDAMRLTGSIGVLGLLFGDFAGGTVVLLLANQLINAQYSQSAETGADAYAHALLTEAGLPPAAMARFFQQLADEHGDTEGVSAFFSSHPQLKARIAAAEVAEGQRKGVGTPSLSASQWQAMRHVCGVPENGPKDGPKDGPENATEYAPERRQDRVSPK